MSDDWLDRAYRSRGTPPEELDARVLAAASRATRRWTPPAVAAGLLVIAAAGTLGFLITSHELRLGADGAASADSPAQRDRVGIDVVQPSAQPERLGSPAHGMVHAPPDAPQAEPEDGWEPLRTSPELNCERSALIGPLGGPGRRDLVQVCSGGGSLRIEVVWDGEPPCPSSLELKAPLGVPVSLDGQYLVVAESRHRCANGQWIATGPERPGGPTTRRPD